MSILLSKATLIIHSAQQAEIQMQILLATYDCANYWNTLSSMKTNAWIHLVSKEGKRSQGVSCSVSWHNLPKDDRHIYWYLPAAGKKAKGGLQGVVRPTADEQSKQVKVYHTRGKQ